MAVLSDTQQEAQIYLKELVEFFPYCPQRRYRELAKALGVQEYKVDPDHPAFLNRSSLDRLKNVLDACNKLKAAGVEKELIRDIFIEPKTILMKIILREDNELLQRIFPNENSLLSFLENSVS